MSFLSLNIISMSGFGFPSARISDRNESEVVISIAK